MPKDGAVSLKLMPVLPLQVWPTLVLVVSAELTFLGRRSCSPSLSRVNFAVFFCSQGCQLAGWKQHRLLPTGQLKHCKPLRCYSQTTIVYLLLQPLQLGYTQDQTMMSWSACRPAAGILRFEEASAARFTCIGVGMLY